MSSNGYNPYGDNPYGDSNGGQNGTPNPGNQGPDETKAFPSSGSRENPSSQPNSNQPSPYSQPNYRQNLDGTEYQPSSSGQPYWHQNQSGDSSAASGFAGPSDPNVPSSNIGGSKGGAIAVIVILLVSLLGLGGGAWWLFTKNSGVFGGSGSATSEAASSTSSSGSKSTSTQSSSTAKSSSSSTSKSSSSTTTSKSTTTSSKSALGNGLDDKIPGASKVVPAAFADKISGCSTPTSQKSSSRVVEVADASFTSCVMDKKKFAADQTGTVYDGVKYLYSGDEAVKAFQNIENTKEFELVELQKGSTTTPQLVMTKREFANPEWIAWYPSEKLLIASQAKSEHQDPAKMKELLKVFGF